MKALAVSILVLGVAMASQDMAPTTGISHGGSESALTELDYFDVEALGASNRCVGVGFDGTYLWVTDGAESGGLGDNKIHIITVTSPHTLVGSYDQDNTSSWGLRDLCFDGTYMFGSEDNQVDYYDISTYAKAGMYYCYAVSPNRAQGWDGTYFYTGSFTNTVYQVTWDGVSGSTATYTTFSTAIANNGIYGAAYDAVNNCLWCSTASGDGMLYQIDMTGTLITSYSLSPESSTSGGCTMGPYEGLPNDQLWVLAQATPDGVYCWQVNDLALQPATWGAIKSMF